jgi:hypothetical protein
MGASRRCCCLVLLGFLTAGIARAQSPQEKRRSNILNELGLKKKPPAPPPETTPAPAAGEAPADGGEKPPPSGEPAAKPKGAGRSASPAGPSFGRVIHPQLMATCKPCHAPGAPAGGTHFLLSGEPAADHHAVVRFVDVHNPDESPLLGKVAGITPHAGGAPWPTSSPPYQRMIAWIRGGARLDAAAPAAPVPPVAPVVEPAAPRAPATRRSPTTAPPAPPSPGGEAKGAPPEAPPGPAAPAPQEAAAPAAPAVEPTAPRFAATVEPILTSGCAVCHRPGGPAAMTRLLLSGDAAKDETTTRALVDPQAPEESLLLRKASGEMHGGGPVLPPGDPRLATIAAWVRGLAPAEIAAPTPAPGVAVGAPPPPATAPVPAGPLGHPGRGGPPGLALPLGFMLDGRFSLDYERRQFTGDPFGEGSVNALRSYHHFLFLSRDAAGDPCGLSLEVLTLQFWEAHCRVGPIPAPLRLVVAGGKIVVPFGADPLYHQNYGGLGGFDQPVLPVIWAVEGAAAHLVVERRALVLTDDLFVVRGYALPHADSIINLQSGFSSEDATTLGWGNRLGVAWMFASAWYSAYYNPLGFGRRLFMQAVDLTIWRPRGVPVLGHFSLGAGFIRADVSGGGPGTGGVGFDYYDFADYLQLRYYPTDWLYVQYRSGLRTFNNRRGIVLDKSRLTNADASTHNFAVVARCRGLTVGLYYFINLEKVDELPNDLFRLSVVYEF